MIIKGLDFAQKKKGMGLCSAAEDFLHFNQMLLNGGELFGRRLLSPETVNLMSSNQVGDLFANAGEGEKSQKGMGFGYAVAITLDPETAGNHRGKGSFGWGGAGGTVSWVDPPLQDGVHGRARLAVRHLPQPTQLRGHIHKEET